jgi:hypothetical protein
MKNVTANSETVTLKVPVAIPYLQNTDFERVNGEFEHNGEFFRLVKQRFASDTLYIVCIKDTRSKHIKQALAEYVKTFSDHPVTSTSPIHFLHLSKIISLIHSASDMQRMAGVLYFSFSYKRSIDAFFFAVCFVSSS